MERRSRWAALLAALACGVPGGARAEAPEAAAAVRPRSGGTLEARLRKLLGQPGGLTSDEVARRATVTSLDVRAKSADLAAAGAEVDKALVAFLPRLTLTARYTRLSDIDQPSFGPDTGSLVATPAGEGPVPPGAPLVGVPPSAFSFPVIVNQYWLQANLTVPVSDYFLRTSHAYRATLHGERAARIDARAARLDAAAKARILYYAWVRARLQQEVAVQNLEQTRAHVRAAEALLEVDRASKADVLRARSRVASAELLLGRARNLAEIQENRLRTAMHDRGRRSYRIGEDLSAPDREAAGTADPEALYEEALRQRLEVRALERTLGSLRDQRKAARAAGYPRLDAFGNAYYANPNPRFVPQVEQWRASWDVGVQLTWTPNHFATSRAVERSLAARQARVAARKEQLRDALRNEVLEAHRALREAQLAIRTAERGLRAAEEAYRARLERFRVGRATSVELTDAESDLLRSRLETIDGRVDLRMARVRLDHALGRDARRGRTEPSATPAR